VARMISEDAAGCWLWLLPNLQVVAKGVGGTPVNIVAGGYDLSGIRKS
jgi:hypothetical protein